MVRCGVPSEGENVYEDGISRLTITTQDILFLLSCRVCVCVREVVQEVDMLAGKYCEALSATQTNLAVFAREEKAHRTVGIIVCWRSQQNGRFMNVS
jgi:hypothetical protein